jgi:Family of unknown function (DUF6263)
MRALRLLAAAGTACAIVVVLSGSVAIGQDVSLRYHWTTGDQLRYRTIQQSAMTMSGLPGMDNMTVTTTVTQVQQLTADEVAADGAATVRVRFESFKLESSSPAGSIVYDSAAPPAGSADSTVGSLAQVIGALVGESFTVVLAPNGAVRGVDGVSRLREKMQATASPATAAMLQSFGSMMSDDAIRSTFNQSFGLLPDTTVKSGDTWQRTLTMPNPLGQMTVATTLTMKGTDMVNGRDVARIGVAQKINVAPGGAIGPISVEVGEGAGDGEILYDYRQGRMVHSVSHVNLPLAMSMTAPDGSTINMDGVTRTTVTTELVER